MNRPRPKPRWERNDLAWLRTLAGWPAGTGAVSGLICEGVLRRLVALGVADEIEPDAGIGARYRVNAAGIERLRAADR